MSDRDRLRELFEDPEAARREIREAALRLSRAAFRVPSGPWTSWVEGRDHLAGDSFIGTANTPGVEIYTHTGSTARAEGMPRDMSEAIQDWVALMNPELVEELIVWMREEARLSEEQQRGPSAWAIRLALRVASEPVMDPSVKDYWDTIQSSSQTSNPTRSVVRFTRPGAGGDTEAAS